jgi:hypothetical protein
MLQRCFLSSIFRSRKDGFSAAADISNSVRQRALTLSRLTARMFAMRKLPVVPICRGVRLLIFRN